VDWYYHNFPAAALFGDLALMYKADVNGLWNTRFFTLAIVTLAGCTSVSDRDLGGLAGVDCGQCAEDQVCVSGIGCADCTPGYNVCQEQTVHECNPDGTVGSAVEECGGQEVCSSGACVTACQRAADLKSNVGCEYYAVDLDNEYSQTGDIAAAQFAVAIANASTYTVTVTVDRNDGAVGSPPVITTVATREVAPFELAVIELPQREVDGSTSKNNGPGTFLSSRAYRVTSNYPVVAYQFNPIDQEYSNGASLLLPTPALDKHHWVLGWPTANPIDLGFSIPGIPDHSYVTIVGVTEAPVSVEVTLGGPIVGGGGIPATGKGQKVTATLRAFDVLNLESDGAPGDMSGSLVKSSGPVAVFSGGERAIVPYDVKPPPPSGYDGELCCTEHIEQQVYPTVALGKDFVVTRSPIRSTVPQSPEADIYRIMGTKAGTQITTTLAAPYDSFTVEPGKWVEFWSVSDFVVTATEPIILAQYLVSQTYVEDYTVGGDPEFILFPPAEQHRNDFLFLTPPTFDVHWVVVAAPAEAFVTVDGADSAMACSRHDAGTLGQTSYVALRCQLGGGVHRVESDVPIGATAYGYHNVGSYGYAAGADIRRINEVQ